MSVSNPEQANEVASIITERKEQELEDLNEAATTRQWLEAETTAETRMITVGNEDPREFEFTTPGTDTVADVAELAPSDIDDEGASLGDAPAMLRACCDVLAEHCLDPAMDREAWGSLSPDLVEEAFSELAGSVTSEDALDAEEAERVDGFRQK